MKRWLASRGAGRAKLLLSHNPSASPGLILAAPQIGRRCTARTRVLRLGRSLAFPSRLRFLHGTAANLKAIRPQPAGFSLLEVILATALLMGAAVVLSRLAGMGREQSQAARTLDALQGVCERTLGELLLGLRPLVPAEDQPLLPVESPMVQPAEPIVETPVGRFAVPNASSAPGLADGTGAAAVASAGASTEADPEYRCSIRMQPQPAFPGMWTLTVEVAEGDQQQPRRRRFSLTRWISGPAPAGAFADPYWQQSPDDQIPISDGPVPGGGLLP